jgi:hypothetical protein
LTTVLGDEWRTAPDDPVGSEMAEIIIDAIEGSG